LWNSPSSYYEGKGEYLKSVGNEEKKKTVEALLPFKYHKRAGGTCFFNFVMGELTFGRKNNVVITAGQQGMEEEMVQVC